MRARIYPLALGKILHHTIANLNQEVAGLMIGKVVSDVVEVWDAVTGLQQSSPAYVKLEESVMALVAEVLMENIPDLYIVGWYHSHPGLNVFMSPIDVETQKAYQAMFPKAIALVIDPLQFSVSWKVSDLKIGVFRIDKNEKVVPVRFTLGLQRRKVLESTLIGLQMLDLIPKKTDIANEERAKISTAKMLDIDNIVKFFSKTKKLLPSKKG
ncbi:MAG: Mov34/MPN/PAD-1 family protein [Nitrososphaerota archaeon]|nr:Mov34/MPN/PAD-1 family protein [Aigarchaeota archaeon]MDW8076335.1 Mov34/MPN/PAD-1 family protein [Nitrososphaerota archaeon]